jgi:hypothetical protein
MLLTIGFAVAAEDVRHFQLRAIHRARWLEVLGWFGLDLDRDRTRQQIQRTRCRADFASRYAEILQMCCSTFEVHADMRLKEKALSRTEPLGVKTTRYRPDDKLLAFLEGL